VGLFDGKVAIVTGAGRGIGRGEAILLAAEGAKVVVNDLGAGTAGEGSDDRPAQQVVEEITSAGGEAVANFDDVSTMAGGQALVDQALSTWGRLDVLVNNAGILRDRMSFSMSEEEWDVVIAVVLKGHFAPTRAAVAHWRNVSKETGAPVGAAIVNTSSSSGLWSNAGQLNYAAAKAGIASMSIVLARELERYGVRSNAIAPAARTRLTAPLMGDQQAEGFDPLDPDGIAPLVAWLASDLAAGVTGQVFTVQANQIQALEGWRPVTQLDAPTGFSIADIDARKDELFGGRPTGAPRFMPPVE
jgi:NAD(P)-dependent dehydrogenase (short-subunit alcohol dehydrogenase family)